MSKKIRVGVVGAGYWGPNLIRNFKGTRDCELKMICDRQAERLKHLSVLYPDVEVTRDYGHMFNGVGLNAIVIATPVNTHYPLAMEALKAGRHVFIEKPQTASVEHSEELIALAKKNGLVLMTGHTFLYSPVVRKIKEIIDKGDIGEIRSISARRLNLGLFQKDINVAWDLAPHDISIILYLLGEMPLTVNCTGDAHVTPGIEDVTSMFLRFTRNRSVTIQSSWLEPRKVREMTIVGSKRMIVYDDLAPVEKIRVYDIRVERPPHYDSFQEFQYSYHYGDMYAPHVKEQEPLKLECQEFIDCIRNGMTPRTSGEQGLEVVRVLDASSKSLRENGKAIELCGKAKKPADIAAAKRSREHIAV